MYIYISISISKVFRSENTLFKISKYRYTPMITSQNSIRNVSVATDEGPSSKLALSEGGSRGNIES